MTETTSCSWFSSLRILSICYLREQYILLGGEQAQVSKALSSLDYSCNLRISSSRYWKYVSSLSIYYIMADRKSMFQQRHWAKQLRRDPYPLQAQSYLLNNYISMGCVDSSCHTPALYSNLKPEIRDKVIDIISRDDIVELLQLQANENYPANIELSQSGLKWTSIHFCCRFDSPSCLDYFLKKCFLQNVKQYLFFVNQQTLEGSTCLHLCAIWSAKKCLTLLLKYGGLNLSLRDKKHKTAETILNDYGLKDLQRTVTQLKAKQGFITEWNYQLLFQISNLNQLRNPQYFDEQLARINAKLSTKLSETSKTMEPSEDERRLRQQKAKLQLEREQIHEKLKLKLQQLVRKEQLQEMEVKEEGQIKVAQGQGKNEETQKLQGRLKQKEEEIQRLKYNIQRMSSEQVCDVLEMQNQKIDLQATSTKQSLLQLSSAFHAYKQELINNKPKYTPIQSNHFDQRNPLRASDKTSKQAQSTPRQQLTINAQQSKQPQSLKQQFPIVNSINDLPEAIRQRYKKAKEKGSFQDQQFPHSQSSLGGKEYQAKIKPFLSSLVWLRPSSFLTNHFQLFDGIDPNDIKQGQLGVCYCLATISQYARNPINIMEIFQFYDLQLGFYVLRFYTNGRPNFVVVDDYFPCSSSSKQPLFTKPIGNQIWVLLIEKAWAKIIGSYFSAQSMTPDLFMQDLTGSPTYGAWFKDKKDKMKDIIAYSPKNYLIVLTTGNKKIQGIVNNHAYSLLKVIEHNGAYIYQIRNPWGNFEWNGCYGQQSNLWTPQLKKKCDYKGGDDGLFFLSESQLLQAFQYYSIGLDQPSAKYSFIQFQTQLQEVGYFRFKLAKKGMAAIKITQPFSRILKDKQYKYSPVIFELGKIEGTQVRFMSEGSDKCYFGDKSVYVCNEIYKQYQAGEYFVRVKVQWVNPLKYNSAVLSIYCQQNVCFERIKQSQGLPLWTKMLYSYVQSKKPNDLNEDIAYLMEWMRGQMICYCTVRPNREGRFKVKWTFNQNQLQNCKLALNKVNESVVEYIIEKEERYCIGTIDRIQISKGCKSGRVSIQSSKV